MVRTAVACMCFAATFIITAVTTTGNAWAAPDARPAAHIRTSKPVTHLHRQTAAAKQAPAKGTPANTTAANTTAASATPATAAPVPAAPVTKTVRFDGYTFDVPAGWPVYQLDQDPAQCVRYDVNAVYLGTPGADQQCPAGLIGQRDTVSIASCVPAGPQSPVAQLPGYPVAERQSAETSGAKPASPGVSITATYGSDPGVVQRILHTVRRSGTGAPVALHQMAPAQPAGPSTGTTPATAVSGATASCAQSAPVTSPVPATQATPGTATPAAQPASAKPSTTPATTTPAATPSPTPVSTPSPTPKPTSTASLTAKDTKPMPGFDTCTAPSVSAMQAWRKTYSAAAIYIGGVEMACDYGNLSASWVKAVRQMGWSLIPIYVGVQAPCNSFSQEIDPAHAAPEGSAAAGSAVADAKMFGLGKNGPIYFDMEAYNNGNSTCRNSVLSFLNSWTRQLHSLGYVSGVYSSAASGAEDLGTATSVYARPLAKPDSMWFALWDNHANLNGTPYLLSSWWNPDKRIKQYQGSHWVKVGGVRLNIDSDWVQGAVYP